MRQFLAGWVATFGGLAIYHGCVQRHPILAASLGGIAIAGVIASWLAPSVFQRVYVVATRLTRPIGWVVSQLVLALMFFAVLTPLAVAFKVLRRDRLLLTKPALASSFWRPRSRAVDLRRYFRSY